MAVQQVTAVEMEPLCVDETPVAPPVELDIFAADDAAAELDEATAAFTEAADPAVEELVDAAVVAAPVGLFDPLAVDETTAIVPTAVLEAMEPVEETAAAAAVELMTAPAVEEIAAEAAAKVDEAIVDEAIADEAAIRVDEEAAEVEDEDEGEAPVLLEDEMDWASATL